MTDNTPEIVPFPDIPQFIDAMRRGVEACNGFVYNGGDLEAQIRFVRWMRTNPDEATILLNPDLGR